MPRTVEVNYDGLVGPTHNYAGLAWGNIASMTHAKQISNPRAAVLQGLEKMALLHKLGIPQAIIPPQLRPHNNNLDNLAVAYSASSMWTANAATVSPSADTQDERVHFTPANLMTHKHRAQETGETARMLKQLFPDECYFCHHDPVATFSDEGAANHLRICADFAKPGIEIFVYGQPTSTYPARQSLAASQAVARLHQLDNIVFVEQTPEAIQAGVFHNDVIATAHKNFLLIHEQAWVDQINILKKLEKHAEIVVIPKAKLSLAQAVGSYLFNSQIVTDQNNQRILIAPKESEYLAEYLDCFDAMYFVDLKQSMQNGGGPACLRLRVVLTPEQRQAAHQGVYFTEILHQKLKTWAQTYYRESLQPADLANPTLAEEAQAAHQALEKLLGLC